MRTLWILLLLLPLAGCLDENPVDSDRTSESTASDQLPHGTAQRDDGTVSTQLENGRYVTRQTITLQNGIGDARSGDLFLDGFNGAIVVSGNLGGGYHLTVELYAQGTTEAESRAEFDRLTLDTQDTLAAGRMSVRAEVIVDEAQAPLIDLNGASVQAGSQFTLVTDGRIPYAFDLDTSNGPITTTGLQGSSLRADTSNGPITLDGTWDSAHLDTSNGPVALDGEYGRAEIDTSNGPITLDGRFDDLLVDTSNGPIRGDLARLGSGSGAWVFDTSNGKIDLFFSAPSSTGWDVRADTSNGGIQIDLPDTETLEKEDDYQHVRTRDYASKDARTEVTLDTSNGSIQVDS